MAKKTIKYIINEKFDEKIQLEDIIKKIIEQILNSSSRDYKVIP